MVERLLRAQLSVSVANHVKARHSLIERAVTWLPTASGWARSKRSAICSGKLCGSFIIFEKCCPCGEAVFMRQRPPESGGSGHNKQCRGRKKFTLRHASNWTSSSRTTSLTTLLSFQSQKGGTVRILSFGILAKAVTMLTYPEFWLQMSKSLFVFIPIAVEIHAAVLASLNYLQFYKAKNKMHIRYVQCLNCHGDKLPSFFDPRNIV